MAKVDSVAHPYRGHLAETLNICHDSDPDNPHPLRANDGSFSSRLENDSYSAAICHDCAAARTKALCGFVDPAYPDLRCYRDPKHRGKHAFEEIP